MKKNKNKKNQLTRTYTTENIEGSDVWSSSE